MSPAKSLSTSEVWQKLREILGKEPYIYNTNLILAIKIPKGAKPNQRIPVQMSISLGQGPLISGYDIQVPSKQGWILTEVHVPQKPVIDGKLQIFKKRENNKDIEDLLETLPLSIISFKQPLPRLIMLEPGKWLSTSFIPLTENKGTNEVSGIALIEAVVISFDFTNLSLTQIAEIINNAYLKLDC